MASQQNMAARRKRAEMTIEQYGKVLADHFGFEWKGLPPHKAQHAELSRLKRLEVLADLVYKVAELALPALPVTEEPVEEPEMDDETGEDEE